MDVGEKTSSLAVLYIRADILSAGILSISMRLNKKMFIGTYKKESRVKSKGRYDYRSLRRPAFSYPKCKPHWNIEYIISYKCKQITVV